MCHMTEIALLNNPGKVMGIMTTLNSLHPFTSLNSMSV